MLQHKTLALALAAAAALFTQACSDNGGTVAGEDITFDLVEATCDTSGTLMTIRMIDEVESEEGAALAKEVLALELDPASVAIGEDIDLAVQGGPTLSYSTDGAVDDLPERLGESGVRVLDGVAFSGTLVLDEADCEGPTAVGVIDAKLRTAAQDDTFQVDVAFSKE